MLHGLFFEAQGKWTTLLGFWAAQGYARQAERLGGGSRRKNRRKKRKAHIYCGRLRWCFFGFLLQSLQVELWRHWSRKVKESDSAFAYSAAATAFGLFVSVDSFIEGCMNVPLLQTRFFHWQQRSLAPYQYLFLGGSFFHIHGIYVCSFDNQKRLVSCLDLFLLRSGYVTSFGFTCFFCVSFIKIISFENEFNGCICLIVYT